MQTDPLSLVPVHLSRLLPENAWPANMLHLYRTRLCAPRFSFGRMTSRDSADDEVLGNIASGEVKMPERAAEFAGSIETGNWLSINVNDALPGIMYGTTLRVRQRCPHRRSIERRRFNRRHRPRRTIKILIATALAHCVPARNALFKHGSIARHGRAAQRFFFARGFRTRSVTLRTSVFMRRSLRRRASRPLALSK